GEVALKQRVGVAVEARIDSLRKVDDDGPSSPDQDVVLGKVRVDDVVGKPELDLPRQEIEDPSCFFEIPANLAQLRRRLLLVTYPGHEQVAANLRERSRHVGPCQ